MPRVSNSQTMRSVAAQTLAVFRKTDVKGNWELPSPYRKSIPQKAASATDADSLMKAFPGVAGPECVSNTLEVQRVGPVAIF